MREDPEAAEPYTKSKQPPIQNRNPFSLELSQLVSKQQEPECQKQQYYFKYVLGKGGFGKVWCAEHKKTRK